MNSYSELVHPVTLAPKKTTPPRSSTPSPELRGTSGLFQIGCLSAEKSLKTVTNTKSTNLSSRKSQSHFQVIKDFGRFSIYSIFAAIWASNIFFGALDQENFSLSNDISSFGSRAATILVLQYLLNVCWLLLDLRSYVFKS